MHAETLSEICDDISDARSALNDALQLAQAHIMAGGFEGNGWLAEVQRIYGELGTLEQTVQDAATRKAAA